MRTYRQLFAVAEFRALFVVQCLAVGGASIGNLALGTITYASTGSTLLTSLAVFGGPIIRLVASWFLASTADLIRPRNALAASPRSPASPTGSRRCPACRGARGSACSPCRGS